MRRLAIWAGCMGILLSAGCVTDRRLTRPEHPEEFRLPPQDDPRYSKPLEIPREYLDPKKPRNPFEKNDFTPPNINPGAGGVGPAPGRPGGL